MEANTFRDLLDARLKRFVADFPNKSQALDSAMAAAVSPLGKRFRGTLLLLVAAQTGEIDEILVDAACAIEILHAASLVIDDLPAMDNANMRRGKPTNHVVHGEDTAILAGIALVADTMGYIARSPHGNAEIRAQMIEILARATGAHGLCAGQELDLRATKSAEKIENVQDLKTGALFVASFELIAVAQNLGDEMRATLVGIGQELGRIFQLCDDLYDALGYSEELGKDVGKDMSGLDAKAGILSVSSLEEGVEKYHFKRQNLASIFHELWPEDQTIIRYIDGVLPDGDEFATRIANRGNQRKSSLAG